MRTAFDLAWAAGFLDGEGNYYFRHGPGVQASQCDLRPLERLQRILGGTINGPHGPYGGRKSPFWNWQVYGPRAIGVMLTLHGLAAEPKRDQITACLTKWKAAPGQGYRSDLHAPGV